MMTQTRALRMEEEKRELERKKKLTSEEKTKLTEIKQGLHNYYSRGQKKKKKKNNNKKQ